MQKFIKNRWSKKLSISMLKNVLYTLIIKLKVQVQIQFGYNSQYYIVTNIEVQIFLIFYTLKASFTAGTCQLDSANGAIHPTTGMHCLWLFILIKTFFLQFFGYTLKIRKLSVFTEFSFFWHQLGFQNQKLEPRILNH